MTDNKTKPTVASVQSFIADVEHAGKRADAEVLDTLFRRVTGQDPVMWGPSIIGYGAYNYETDAGRKGTICRVGFSPRKAKHSFYLMSANKDADEAPYAALRDRLGKYSQGKGCLYVNKLADVDMDVLKAMIAMSWANASERYPV